MTFFDYMARYKALCSGSDGALARLALRSHGSPRTSSELSDWVEWLKSLHGGDSLADGLQRCWWQWHDRQAGTVEQRCPRCGTPPRYHVTDVYQSGRRAARAWICPTHGLYFIVERKTDAVPELDAYAKLAITMGRVTQIY